MSTATSLASPESGTASPTEAPGTAISVVVPVTERPQPLEWIYREYAPAIRALDRPFEFLFVVEPWGRGMVRELEGLMEEGEPIRSVEVGAGSGESRMLQAATRACRGELVVTLPPYARVRPEGLAELVRRVEDGADLVTAARSPDDDSPVNRLQNRAFHLLLRAGVGSRFRDIASGVRVVRKEVLDEVPCYGSFFRFLPLLAEREGFRVREIEVEQHPRDAAPRLYSPAVYLRRLIDLLGVSFLVRFTRKPLRFFGLVGSLAGVPGAAILLVLLVQRLAGQPLAGRPLLLLGVLLVVLGVQVVGIGLVGEIVVHLDVSSERYRIRDE